MKKLICLSLVWGGLWALEDSWCAHKKGAVWADAVYLKRSQVVNKQLIIKLKEGTTASYSSLCKTTGLVGKFDFEPGFRVGAAYVMGKGRLEGSYLWVEGWQASCHKANDGRLYFSTDSLYVDYARADRAEVRYGAHFENAELNYYHHGRLPQEVYFSSSWLVGLRYVHLWDAMKITYENDGRKSHYSLKTKDDLGAVQVGTTIQWYPLTVMCWDITAKVGTGADWAKDRVFFGDVNDTVVVAKYTRSKWHPWPFFVEGSVSLAYHPWSFLDLKVGYQFFYVTGVATAPDQIQKRNIHPHLRFVGEALIYGAFAGLVFSF